MVNRIRFRPLAKTGNICLHTVIQTLPYFKVVITANLPLQRFMQNHIWPWFHIPRVVAVFELVESPQI